MPTTNKISATLVDADIAAIQTALNTIKNKLPFLITLSIKERESLRKLASKRQGYVKSTAEGVNAFPDAMPNNFPTEEYLKDSNLMVAFNKVAPQILGLASNVEDTLMQLGSELITNTDLAYGYLKQGVKVDANIKPTIQKIAAGLKQKATPVDAEKVKE